MAKVNLKPEEWGDFIVIFLLDAIIHDNILDDNENFRKLINNLEKKGAKPIFLKYYLDLPASLRVDYKRVRNSIIGKDTSSAILNIGKSEV